MAKNEIKNYDIRTEVAVKNNFVGTLIYISKKSGVEVIWENYGDVNYMTIEELINMRNTQKSFFQNNWILIDEEEAIDILKFLQVFKYYEKSFECNIETLMKDTPATIKKKIGMLSKEVKENLIVSISNLIENGEIDSVKRIKAFEEAFEVSFSDKY